MHFNFILTSLLKSLFDVVFGYSAYFIPLFLFTIGILIFNTKKNIETKKYIYCLIIIAILSSLFDIYTTHSFESLASGQNVFVQSFNYATNSNGGIIGATFGGLLKKLVGKFISSFLLIIALFVVISFLFEKSHSELFTYFKSFFTLVKDKVEKSIGFDSNSEDEYFEKDIVFKDDKSKLKIDRDKVFSVKPVEEPVIKEIKEIDELEEIKNIDYSVNYGINRKRETTVSDFNNSKEGNGLFKKNLQKPKPNTMNIRKINPFSKKPKINLFDLSNYANEIDQTSLRNLNNISQRTNSEDKYFVNVRKTQKQEDENVSLDYHDETPVINEEVDTQVQENTNIHLAQIEQYEKTIKSLKEELDRQMFLFQDTQIQFIEQKKVEKSLLKIINAQRETIEKQYAEIRAYENIAKNISSVNLHQSTVEQITTPIETPVESMLENDDLINSTLSQIQDDSLKLAIESTETISPIEFPEDDFTEIDIVEDVDDVVDEVDNFEDEQDYSQSDDNTGVSFEVKETDVNEYIENFTFDDDDETDGFDDDDFDPTFELKEAINSEVHFEPTVQTVSPVSDSIFRTEVQEPKAEYRQPIKPNFDLPEVEEEKYIYQYPTVDFLDSKPVLSKEQSSKTELIANSKKLEMTLKSFGVVAKVLEVSRGPSVTRYEVQPGLGVKVSKIANLSDDLALNLAAKSIRIQAPIPGKPAVGIEIPNENKEMVYLREVLDDQNFKNFKSKLAFGIGKDIAGKIVVADLATMPHLLIAGSTGSGKSVCVNTLITSIVYKSSPDEVKLLMIDPKVVELSVYNGIPHLLIPVVTDPKKAAASLNWAVREMEKRYKLFSDKRVRDLKGYNEVAKNEGIPLEPQIVIIIDELADLMMTASKEVESAIIRIAQMARAAGIHLIIATQRPTVDVITGLIKSNIPSRIAFAVSSGIDSKTILDETGAEKLLGKGDMLFKPMGSPEPFRIQGAFISDKEVESIVSFLKTDTDHDQMKEIIEEITSSANPKSATSTPSDTVDEILEDVVEFIITNQKASTSLIQRKFKVGFNRAARIIDELEEFGVIGPDEGNKPRKVLMSLQEWDNKFKV